jgi:hypothetical protein
MHTWLETQAFRFSSCVIEPANKASVRVAQKLGYVPTSDTLLAGTPVTAYRRGV